MIPASGQVKVEKLAISICLYKRERNWPDLLKYLVLAAKGLTSELVVCIWNNNRDSCFEAPEDHPLNFYIANSNVNYICLPRYFMPLLLAGERGSTPPSHFCFLDDDILPTEGFFQAIVSHYEKIGDPNAMVGARGGILGKMFGAPRLEGPNIELTEVDYIAGQTMMGSVHLLYPMIMEPPPRWIDHAEDLWECYLTQKYFGTRKYAVPTPKVARHSKRGVNLTDTDRNEAYFKLRREFGFRILADETGKR